MEKTEKFEEAVEILQQLGFKEYEARCFVGLTCLETGTAKRLSELTEVPRTRVYDATRVLEAHGLVEIQHSSPKRFKAVPLAEGIETFRDQHEERINRLHDTLSAAESIDENEESPVQEVWSMTGQGGIENRTEQLIRHATDEVVLVIGDRSLLTEELIETLNSTGDSVDLCIGAITPELQEEIQAAVPDATTFVSGLEWLRAENVTADGTAIGRLLLVDRSAILVSSIMPDSNEEKAVFGEGFRNGLVVIARRLMAQGLLPSRDPSS